MDTILLSACFSVLTGTAAAMFTLYKLQGTPRAKVWPKRFATAPRRAFSAKTLY